MYKIQYILYTLHYQAKWSQIMRMRVVNFSEARQRLKSVLDSVASDTDFTVVTRRDAEDVVVMSMTMFNKMVETLGFPEAENQSE